MNILRKLRLTLKKAWYQLSPTARNFTYLKHQINEIQQFELLRDSQLVHKSDIRDIVKQCVEFSQIVKEYILRHQNDSSFYKMNTEIYNSYKWIETLSLPRYIYSRFDHDWIEDQLRVVAGQNKDKHIYILTDLLDYDYPFKVIALNEVVDYSKDETALFILAYRFDWNAIEAVSFFIEHNLKYQPLPQTVPMSRYLHINQAAYETLMDEQMNAPRSHYCPVDFENIFQALEATRELPGDYVEIGTYQGASARAALNYMRRTGIHRNAYFLDTYEGFTYENAKESSDAHWYGTHTETSLEKVTEYLSEYTNANIIKSNIIAQKLPDRIKSIALCNIDVDIYDAVYAALKKISPLIVEHGIIIAEDYGHTPLLIGAQYAVKKFLAESPDFIPFYFSSGQILLLKVGANT